MNENKALMSVIKISTTFTTPGYVKVWIWAFLLNNTTFTVVTALITEAFIASSSIVVLQSVELEKSKMALSLSIVVHGLGTYY